MGIEWCGQGLFSWIWTDWMNWQGLEYIKISYDDCDEMVQISMDLYGYDGYVSVRKIFVRIGVVWNRLRWIG